MPDVLMPRLSDTMQDGVVHQWRKQEGDPVHRGDILAEIETDKATMELEAYDDGNLSRILVAEGATVAIGTPIAIIDSTTPRPQTREAPTEGVKTTAGPATEGEALPAATPPRPDRPPVASPLARTLAREHGIDLATLHGSGPGGRIVRADVNAAIAGQAPQPTAPEPRRPPLEQPPPAAEADVEEIPLTRVRQLTAQRLTDSAQRAPHFYLTRDADADPLLQFRSQINTDLDTTGVRVSVTDLLIKACATTLAYHPDINSTWAETRILRYRRIHIGFAVAIDDGLIVPVIHDAGHKTLSQISREAHDLTDKARTHRLTPEEITGATFTISNLGMYGIDHFTAIINPPQAATLAVGAATTRPIARDNQLTLGTTMALTLSIDHRVIDGATGAQFLTDLATTLQQPLHIVL